MSAAPRGDYPQKMIDNGEVVIRASLVNLRTSTAIIGDRESKTREIKELLQMEVDSPLHGYFVTRSGYDTTWLSDL
ncbi:unnamed protein product [Amoebophrya sp. A25]|nr:unnamed protein product [Amoebophrya sp. A25]|eukprot:GSA25T00021687001.1